MSTICLERSSVGEMLLRHGEARGAGISLEDVIAVFAQRHAEHRADLLIVIDD